MAETTRPASAGTIRVSVLSRFPIRRVIQWILGVGLITFAVYGAYKTLSLHEFTAAAWRDLIVFGIAQGAVYALIALGYTMVYGVLRMINFAHGEVFMFGAFGSYFVSRTLSNMGFLNSQPVLSTLILVVVAVATSVGVAVLLERIAYRPLRGAPRLVPLITAIGASLFLQNTAKGFFGAQTRGYPTPALFDGTWTILGVPILRAQVVVMVVALLALFGLRWFVANTRTGKSMRAVAEDREIASLMGIDVDRIIVTTFAIGGALAGIAAVLFALVFQVVGPFMGFIIGIKAFTAAVLGGIGSIPGAALGGLTVGVLESVGPSLFLTGFKIPGTNQLKDVVAFVILVFVLIFRPGGILGSDEAEKV